MINQIKLIGPEIKGKANETVTLKVTFASPCWSCIHERRAKSGYFRLNDQKGNSEHVYNAVIHEDTTHFIFSIGDEGKPDLGMTNNIGQLWCSVVVSDDKPDTEPDEKDLGVFQYKVGKISDLHICKTNNDWWDEDDFKAVMDFFKKDKDIKFIDSCGDIAESQTNDYQKHPEATCDADCSDFTKIYDVNYWQIEGLRFFSPLGNHDFYGLFESRQGDIITGKSNSETICGYNDNVNKRIANIWSTSQQVSYIVPGIGRIVFDLEKGKSNPVGQADMNFFSYNDYVDLYCKQGGYTRNSVWDSSKGGISDEAIKCAKQYVNSNWSTVKDNLVMWNDGSSHGRNGYSKLNYYLKKDNNIFIYLSVDYGNDIWSINNKWHDRMIHARTIIDIKSDDPYIKRMVEYVDDTEYSQADEEYNYQYYSPNSLIWLKEIIENNTDKKIFINTHHFLPNRVGNGKDRPIDGNWFYSDIHSSSEKDPKEGNIYSIGSNALTGIEFWFISKLLNKHKNVIMFSGHSHISICSDLNFDNHDYSIIYPNEHNKYVYTKSSVVPSCESAWTVSLPSMSKPRDIVDGKSVRKYEDAEAVVMEVYEKGVVLKGYKIKENNIIVNNLCIKKVIKLL